MAIAAALLVIYGTYFLVTFWSRSGLWLRVLIVACFLGIFAAWVNYVRLHPDDFKAEIHIFF